MSEQIVNSKQSLEAYKKFLDAQFEKHHYLRVTAKSGKQRTLTQNASLHLYCELVAEALNDAGFDVRTFFKEGYTVPFCEKVVKKNLWRPLQVAITGNESTTKPKTHEYALIYDALNMKLADHGIYVPWPCKDTMNT